MGKEYNMPEKSIDDISLLEPEATYSYADYLKWSFEERVELIKGKVFRMSPAPNRIHQGLSIKLILKIGNFLEGHKCKIYDAPFDVRLPKKNGNRNEEIPTVIQPDICVICDENKLDDAGCIGAPDIIVEILSPSTASKDLKNKFELYEENGVMEYWIVYPNEQIIEIFKLDPDGKYGRPKKYVNDDIISSEVLPGLKIKVADVFDL